jgi:hypothetical protein
MKPAISVDRRECFPDRLFRRLPLDPGVRRLMIRTKEALV